MYTREELKKIIEEAFAFSMVHNDEATWNALLDAKARLSDYLDLN